MIYVTGDIHIPIDVQKIIDFTNKNKLTSNDYLIICGDSGFMWDLGERSKYWMDWFKTKEYTILFCDGNHENFNLLESLPVETWNGGNVHILNKNIIHLMRGQVFEINGFKFFVFGGGDSIDKENRTEDVSWWRREMPSEAEYREGFKNLSKHNWEVDCIITHSCSEITFNKIQEKYRMNPYITAINKYLDIIEEEVKFKYWFFGHYHVDYQIDENHIALFDEIIELKGFLMKISIPLDITNPSTSKDEILKHISDTDLIEEIKKRGYKVAGISVKALKNSKEQK